MSLNFLNMFNMVATTTVGPTPWSIMSMCGPVSLYVKRINPDHVILHVKVIDHDLLTSSRDGFLTFHIEVHDLEHENTSTRNYISSESVTKTIFQVNHGCAYFFECHVSNGYEIESTATYYDTCEDPICQIQVPTLPVWDVALLKETAIHFVQDDQPSSIDVLFRNNHRQYFEDIKLNNSNIMCVSSKIPNGDPRCPIANVLEGIEFNVGDQNCLPMYSHLGDTRVVIPVNDMINPYTNRLYFSDLYCQGQGHYVQLVVTKPDTPADDFCIENLPSLPLIPHNSSFNNPFFFFDQKCGKFKVTTVLEVSIFYTENIKIDEENHYFENGFGRRSVGYGKPKDPTCITCNLHLLPRDYLNSCFIQNCEICAKIDQSGSAQNRFTGETIDCLKNVSCQIQNVIYLFQDVKCGNFYVGQTSRKLRDRILEHMRGDGKVAKHIRQYGLRRVVILEFVLDEKVRKFREEVWISLLGTGWPKGLNMVNPHAR